MGGQDAFRQVELGQWGGAGGRDVGRGEVKCGGGGGHLEVGVGLQDYMMPLGGPQRGPRSTPFFM